MQRTHTEPYVPPELIVHGTLVRDTRFVGSGAVDGIVGIDVDGDGDDDTVIGNGIGSGS